MIDALSVDTLSSLTQCFFSTCSRSVSGIWNIHSVHTCWFNSRCFICFCMKMKINGNILSILVTY